MRLFKGFYGFGEVFRFFLGVLNGSQAFKGLEVFGELGKIDKHTHTKKTQKNPALKKKVQRNIGAKIDFCFWEGEAGVQKSLIPSTELNDCALISEMILFLGSGYVIFPLQR